MSQASAVQGLPSLQSVVLSQQSGLLTSLAYTHEWFRHALIVQDLPSSHSASVSQQVESSLVYLHRLAAGMQASTVQYLLSLQSGELLQQFATLPCEQMPVAAVVGFLSHRSVVQTLLSSQSTPAAQHSEIIT